MVTSRCQQGGQGERHLSVFKDKLGAWLSVNNLCLPLSSTSYSPGLQPPSPPSSNSLPSSPPRLPPTLHLESGDVRAPNRVSAEVIDSSHRENSPAFSVSRAEPECWRVSETCKQSVAELSGRSQAHRSEREGKRWNKSLFYWEGKRK